MPRLVQKRRARDARETPIIAVISVAKNAGRTMSAGEALPAAARTLIIVNGSSCTEQVLSIINMHISWLGRVL